MKKSIPILLAVGVLVVTGAYLYLTQAGQPASPLAPSDSLGLSTSTAIAVRVPFDLQDLFNGEASLDHSYTNAVNGDTVSFAALTDAAHQAQNPSFDVYVNDVSVGDMSGEIISNPSFSPDNSFFAFEVIGTCGAVCNETEVEVINLGKGTLTTITPPQIEGDSLSGKSGPGYEVNPTIESYSWDNGGLLVTFFLLGIDGESNQAYRITPKQLWQYDLATGQYTFIKDLPEQSSQSIVQSPVLASATTGPNTSVESSTSAAPRVTSTSFPCPVGTYQFFSGDEHSCIPILATTSPAIATSSWETYYDDATGYQVKYPSGTQISPQKSSTDFVLDFSISSTSITTVSQSNPPDVDYQNPALTFRVATAFIGDIGSTTLESWVQENELDVPQAPIPDIARDTYVNGLPAYYVEYDRDNAAFWQGGFVPFFYYFMENNTLYTIQGIKVPQNVTDVAPNNDPLVPYVEVYEKLFNAMLSTFTIKTQA